MNVKLILIICAFALIIALVAYFLFRKKAVVCSPACLDNQQCINGSCVNNACPVCDKDSTCDPNTGTCVYKCGVRPTVDKDCDPSTLICSSNGEWVCPSLCGAKPGTSGSCATLDDLVCDPNISSNWICEKGCSNGNGIDYLDGKGCVCQTNYYGNICQYTKPECTGHGTYSNGVCTCILDPCGNPYTGTLCTDGCDTKCNSNGTWNGSSCSCNSGWSGADCSVSTTVCQNGGTLNQDGTCTCRGSVGSKCQYTAKSCNGGVPSVDSKDNLICDCSQLPNRSAGSKCQYNSVLNCNGNGSPNTDSNDNFISCSCDGDYTPSVDSNGNNCKCSSKVSCNGNGIVDLTGNQCSCACNKDNSGNLLYEGANCQCNVSMKSLTTCNICDFKEQTCDPTCTPSTSSTSDKPFSPFKSLNSESSYEDSDEPGCYTCQTATACPDPQELIKECSEQCNNGGKPMICDDINHTITCDTTCPVSAANAGEAAACSAQGTKSYICNEETNFEWTCQDSDVVTGNCSEWSNNGQNVKPNCLVWTCDATGNCSLGEDTQLATCVEYTNYCNPDGSNAGTCDNSPTPGTVSQWWCPTSPLPFGALINQENLNSTPSTIEYYDKSGQIKVWFSEGDEKSSFPVTPVYNNTGCENGEGYGTKALNDILDYPTLYPNSNITPFGQSNYYGHLVEDPSPPNPNIPYLFVPYNPTLNTYYDAPASN